ncbi:hypothetical protein KCP73_26755 [Salmonella enterica subsp. enterica]|nr:hypothetical protein KCP73_26755 [Salmonella enterica subsp. enterica]
MSAVFPLRIKLFVMLDIVFYCSTHYEYWFYQPVYPSGLLYNTGGVLRGLSLLLLSPTLFILTIRSIAPFVDSVYDVLPT